MPIKYQGQSYKFETLVRVIMKKKGWSKEKASAYVAAIEKRQKGKGK